MVVEKVVLEHMVGEPSLGQLVGARQRHCCTMVVDTCVLLE